MMEDLEKARQLLRDRGCTCAVCRGEETLISHARGVRPLAQWLERGVDLTGFSAADKVVGKATAWLYVLLGVRAVHAGVISKPARDLLTEHGVRVSWDRLADAIINRRGDGLCPFEAAVLEIGDPLEAHRAILNKMAEMGIRLED